MPSLQRLLLIPDCHIPYVDPIAWDVMLRCARWWKPNTIAILGDFIDGLSVTTFDKRPDQMTQLKEEVRHGRIHRKQLDQLGAKRKIFTLGNHDIRPSRLAMKLAPGLFDSLDIDSLLGLSENGWEVYPYQHHAQVGKLRIVHDVGNSGKYACWQNASAFEASVITGHTHISSCVYFGNADGETHISMTAGWLGSRKAAEYLAPIKSSRNWQHGFSVANVEPDGTAHVQFIPIINGKAVLNGKLFKSGTNARTA